MAINPLWLVQKFDYTTGKLLWQNNPITGLKEPVYWDETEIDSFVDSDLGNDSTGNGTAELPYKTLSKVKSIGATKWAAGKKIMARGTFIEAIQVNVSIRIIGAGGYLFGRASIGAGFSQANNLSNVIIDNMYLSGFGRLYYSTEITTNHYYSNCLMVNIYSQSWHSTTPYFCYLYSYDCFFVNHLFDDRMSYRTNIKGNNNTFYNCSIQGSYVNTWLTISGNNNHTNNSIVGSAIGLNNSLNVNGQYLDTTNYNFNFLNTSPLFRTGTYDGDIDNYLHRGAGSEGINLNAASDSLNDDVDAVYTNLEKSGTEIYRTDVGLNGLLESGIIDLGGRRTKVILSTNYTLEQASGTIYRRIQSSEGRTITQILDCVIKYGETEADLASCPDLLIEYGKLITVSGTGDDRKGNADPDFDPDDMIAIDRLIISYLKIIEFKFRSIV